METPEDKTMTVLKILKYKKERVNGKDIRMYLVRDRNQSAGKDWWLAENNIPNASIHLRNFRAHNRNH